MLGFGVATMWYDCSAARGVCVGELPTVPLRGLVHSVRGSSISEAWYMAHAGYAGGGASKVFHIKLTLKCFRLHHNVQSGGRSNESWVL